MAWKGFIKESRSYMAHLPTWKFYLRLPKAWIRFQYSVLTSSD